MSDEPAKTSMPAWAKLLLGFFIAGVILFLSIGGYCAYWIGNMQKRSGEPAYIASVIHKIADVAAAPANFQYVAAYGVANVNVVLVRYAPDGTDLWLMRIPNPSGQSAHEIVDQGAEMASHGKGTHMTVSQRGTEKVGGQELDWVEGPAEGPNKKMAHQFVGVVVINNGRESVRIIGITPGDKYNMDATRQFLATIKGF
jgi:hypothetical protein